MNKILLTLFTMVSLNVGASEFEYFEGEELSGGQCGCWYHHPAKDKLQGKVIGFGEAADKEIHFKVDGKKVTVGNWQAEYEGTTHFISYSSNGYKVDIVSKMIQESRFSSSYDSTITVEFEKTKSVIEAFGSCGC